MLFEKSLQDELIEINQKLQSHEQMFDVVEDEDLIEAIIYEQKALKARYTYLIKRAKAESLQLSFIERKGMENCLY